MQELRILCRTTLYKKWDLYYNGVVYANLADTQRSFMMIQNNVFTDVFPDSQIIFKFQEDKNNGLQESRSRY